jgi:hypothetical protein
MFKLMPMQTSAFLVFPAKAGTHFGSKHRPEPVLGLRSARTRGPVWRDAWRRFAALLIRL